MSALVITPEGAESLIELALYAERNPYTMDDLLDRLNGEMKPPGDQKEFTRFLPVGYKIVFSIEIQQHFIFKHLSVSIDRPGKLPSIEAVEFIMVLLNFQRPTVDECDQVRIEDLGPGYQAINVWQIII